MQTTTLAKLRIVLANWLGRPVSYDDVFFDAAWFDNWHRLKDVLAALVQAVPRWQRVLDFGCGPGIMIDLMNDRGLDWVGCDYSAEARALYVSHYGRYPSKYLTELTSEAVSNRDVVLAFDVFEHMKDQEIHALLQQLSASSELLLNISRVRAIPGHVNIKTDGQWLQYFARRGRAFDQNTTERLRHAYLALRPGGEDRWHENLFVFSGDSSASVPTSPARP